MIRIGIAVEGSTEVEFINNILLPNLLSSGILVTPISIEGNVSIQRLSREMANLYWNFNFISSLVDFYGFQGKGIYSASDIEYNIGNKIKEYIGESVDESRIIPYVQVHEFEALLFSDVEGFLPVMPEVRSDRIEELRQIRNGFNTPEDIDDGAQTAPSKRITGIFRGYRKALHGPLIAENIGMQAIRKQCPRFNEWVGRLSALGAAK